MLDPVTPVIDDAEPVLGGVEALLQERPNWFWRASELARMGGGGSGGGHADQVRASGWAELDAALPGGGWPTRAVIDVLVAQAGVLEWRLLAPALALSDARPVLLINPPHVPYAPGLGAWGLAADRLLCVGSGSQASALPPRHALWATEQALQCAGLSAVLAWLPHARPEQMRRLQVHAQGFDGLCWVMRPESARSQSCAAPLRVLAELTPTGDLSLNVLKRRGPPLLQPLCTPAWPPMLAGLQTLVSLKFAQLDTQQTQMPAAAVMAKPTSRPRQLDHAAVTTVAA